MKINLLGASGAGATTLGKALEQKLGWKYLDSDDYYWQKTNPPYEVKVPLAARNKAFLQDIAQHNPVVASGSMVTWGTHWKQIFDLVVFLYVPPDIRMQRLKNREQQRYGNLLAGNPVIHQKMVDFLDWAAQYDNEAFDGRTIVQHQQWLQQLTCPILKIEGDFSTEERINKIVYQIETQKKGSSF